VPDSFNLHKKPLPALVKSWTWGKKQLTQKPTFATKDLLQFAPVLIHFLTMLIVAKPESKSEMH